MTTPQNYQHAIDAIASDLTQAHTDKQDAIERNRIAIVTEAEKLMRPLTAVMESHPDIVRIDEAETSPSGASIFRRTYRRRGGGSRFCMAICIDPPNGPTRGIYVKTDTTCVNYLSIQASERGRAKATEADTLIPVTLEWCAKLISQLP